MYCWGALSEVVGASSHGRGSGAGSEATQHCSSKSRTADERSLNRVNCVPRLSVGVAVVAVVNFNKI